MNEKSIYDEHVHELVNGGFDGELSATERAELEHLLANSATARTLRDELSSLGGLLDQVPEEQPPEYLENAIISQIRLPLANQAHGNKYDLFKTWLSTFWVRTGLAVAVGVLLTVGIYKTGSEISSPKDLTSMSGTMVKNPEADNGVLIDSIHVNSTVLTSEVKLLESDGMFAMDVTFGSPGSATLNVDFASSNLALEDISGLHREADEVNFGKGSVNIITSGPQHYEIIFRRIATKNDGSGENRLKIKPVELSFYAGSTLIEKTRLGHVE